MPRKRTFKNRKSLRRSRRKSSRGGGWSDGPSMVNPGNLTHNQYTGPGKDCAGVPVRPGYLTSYSSSGLPGLSGGRRHRHRKSRGGQGPITNPNLPPVSGSVTPKPGYFPDTTGAGGTVAKPVTMSMPGVPTQSGGRYGFFPGEGPLNPSNGVGTSPAPFGRIPCESGSYNALNPNPNGVQTMTTVPGRLSGGSQFPTVQVGSVDAMRYNAPTAGYTNDFMTFRAPSPVPGLTIQTPYDARAFNQACIKTGGSRRMRKRRGGSAVANNAGEFKPVTMGEIDTRYDFDGTHKGLPVKFGGRRRTHRRTRHKSRKHKKHYK